MFKSRGSQKQRSLRSKRFEFLNTVVILPDDAFRNFPNEAKRISPILLDILATLCFKRLNDKSMRISVIKEIPERSFLVPEAWKSDAEDSNYRIDREIFL